MRLFRSLVFGVLIALALVPPASAQERIRIALWEVENNAERSWAFWSEMGPAARNFLDTAFSEDAALSSKFAIVERAKLDLVMKEQGLASAGAVTPQTAAKVGALLGVKYIVVGGIDKFAINNTGGRVGNFGGTLQQATATVNLRFIDTTTGERVLAVTGDAEVRKGGGFVPRATGGRENQWGIASETIEKASKAVIAKFAVGGYVERLASAMGPAANVEGAVARVDGGRIYINIGAESGVTVGDRYVVISRGEAIIDPVTGANLGAEEKQTGTAIVTDVQPKFAIAALTGTAEVKSAVRKQP